MFAHASTRPGWCEETLRFRPAGVVRVRASTDAPGAAAGFSRPRRARAERPPLGIQPRVVEPDPGGRVAIDPFASFIRSDDGRAPLVCAVAVSRAADHGSRRRSSARPAGGEVLSRTAATSIQAASSSATRRTYGRGVPVGSSGRHRAHYAAHARAGSTLRRAARVFPRGPVLRLRASTVGRDASRSCGCRATRLCFDSFPASILPN